MKIRKYIARSTREAMAKIRAELGEDAVILKTRTVERGVEVMAMSEPLSGDESSELSREPAAAITSTIAPAIQQATKSAAGDARSAPQRSEVLRPDVLHPIARGRAPRMPDQPMSTVSFQQFVRDRLAQRDAEQAHERPQVRAKVETRAVAKAPIQTQASSARRQSSPAPAPVSTPAPLLERASGPISSTVSSPVRERPPTTVPPLTMPPTLSEVLSPPRPDTDALMAELREMRGQIAEQLKSIARGQVPRDAGAHPSSVPPALMRRLMQCGFSAGLSRKLLPRVPAGLDAAQSERWARQLLTKVIRVDEPGHTLLDTGGIHALVGPTGVGKTTTVAKIAAQFALRHGVESVGLVTVDTYRIGAHDQLRTFGRLLGVPVRVVHDAAGLARFMTQFMNKKLVLIDTVGIGQRDSRLDELLSSLSSVDIRKLLVLNATAQVETLEEVIKAYRVGARAGIVVSKLDEAVKLGGVVDCLVRHRLPLVGVADGQRVPEDWQFPDPALLVERAFAAPVNPLFDFDDSQWSMPAWPVSAPAIAPAARRAASNVMVAHA